MQAKHNHGVTKDGGIRTDYGKDDSDYAGSAAHERGNKLGGGPTDVSHSLSNSSAANQKK